MRVLALDTAMARCSVAVFDAGQDVIAAHVFEDMQRGHAEALSGMIETALAQAGLKIGDIDRIAVTTGPGTFTGVRVGLAMAKGLGLALNLPVIGVSSLEVIAAAAGNGEMQNIPILTAIDARRDEVYAQGFSHGPNAISAPGLHHISGIAQAFGTGPWRLIGSGASLISHELPKAIHCGIDPLPNATFLARLGSQRDPGSAPANPLYLRKPDAKPQKQLVQLDKMDVQIDTAGVHHAEIIGDLQAHCFPSAWPEQDLRDLLTAPGVMAYVAIAPQTKAPVGFILARRAGDEAEILSIGTLPSQRRRKIAAQLLERLIQHLRTSQVKSLFLEVASDNAAARHLYGAIGFSKAGCRKNYYRAPGGERSHALILRLEL